MTKSLKTYLNTGKGLLKFIGGTDDLAICYGRDLSNGIFPIGYCNSDYTGDKSSKSTYGYLFKFAGGPVSWKSKRASTITLST